MEKVTIWYFMWEMGILFQYVGVYGWVFIENHSWNHNLKPNKHSKKILFSALRSMIWVHILQQVSAKGRLFGQCNVGILGRKWRYLIDDDNMQWYRKCPPTPKLSVNTLTCLTVGAFISIRTSTQVVTDSFKTGGSIETRVTSTFKNFWKLKGKIYRACILYVKRHLFAFCCIPLSYTTSIHPLLILYIMCTNICNE